MDDTKLQAKLESSEDYLPNDLCVEIMCCVLKEALDQLFILKKMYGWPEGEATVNEYITLKERFLEKGEPENTNSKVENVQLVAKNCAFVESIFTNLYKELKINQCYDSFTETVGVMKKMKADEENIQAETMKKEIDVKRLKEIFYDEKAYYIEKIMQYMEDTGRIKDMIEDYRLESEIKLKYIEAWENSKIEMNDTLFSQRYQEKQDQIRTTDININKEERVHQEISSVFDEIQKDFNTTIDEWKIKYSEDLKTMNEKVGALQNKQDKQLGEISRMKELYAKRQKEIDDYKHYKVEQEKLRVEMEKRNKAATTIEAWWRGTMVRKGFGKYRKKKEKKGKKKSSEKKSPK